MHSIITSVVPYIGNYPQKKKFTNFVNLELFADVFVHYFPGLPIQINMLIRVNIREQSYASWPHQIAVGSG